MTPLVIGVAVPALTFMAVTGAVSPHHSYPLVSLGSIGGLALPAPEVPHLPMTFYSPLITAGTASTYTRGRPGDPWYSLYGPNIFGD